MSLVQHGFFKEDSVTGRKLTEEVWRTDRLSVPFRSYACMSWFWKERGLPTAQFHFKACHWSKLQSHLPDPSTPLCWKPNLALPGMEGCSSDARSPWSDFRQGDVPGTDVSSREMFDKELPLKDQNYPKLLGLLRQSIVVDVCRPWMQYIDSSSHELLKHI